MPEDRRAETPGRLWSPRAWLKAAVGKWRDLSEEEKRGFKFWVPVALAIGAVELAGALSGAFRNFIPWPTISATIGRLQDAASWVGVIVVAVIAMAAYAAVREQDAPRTAEGRTLPPGTREGEVKKVEVSAPVLAFRYSWPTVFIATGLTAWIVHSIDDRKYVLGYAIYGGFLVFGVLIPSALARWAKTRVRFPTLVLPLRALSQRVPATTMVIVAGLAILVVHLALYPWPDLTRESASYAGLKAGQARTRAAREIKTARAGLPPLVYSAQTRGIAEGREAWLVYFSPATGSGALPYSGCVVLATESKVEPSAECLK